MGGSDLLITPIGLGTWQFSKRRNLIGRFWPYLSDEESYDIVTTSFHNGINWFDTAEAYGNGESEKTLSRALQHTGLKDEDVVIATEWNPFFRTAGSITRTIGKRLEALNPYTISLHQIHNPYSFSGIASEMKAMARLIKEQKIRQVGVSNFTAKQMQKAYQELSRYGVQLVANQVPYNLLNRKIERNGILEAARAMNVSIVAYSPLAQGLLTGKYHEDPESIKQKKGFRKRMPSFKAKGLEKTRPLIDKLKELALKYNATPAQIALNWTINFYEEFIVAIPGASNPQQAESNALAMQIDLTAEDKKQIDKLSLDIS